MRHGGGIMIRREAGGLQISGDVAELAVISVKPEHTLVLHVEGRPSPDDVEHLQKVLQKFFPDNQCLVLLPGMKLELMELKKPPADEAA